MPKQIIKWACSVCNTEYHSEKACLSCENSGLPPETHHIKVGNTIKFIRSVREGEIGEIQTYKSGEGEVLHIVTTRNDKTNKHQSLFVVQTDDESGIYEGIVTLLDVTGSAELYMASSPKYELGFAKSLKEGATNG